MKSLKQKEHLERLAILRRGTKHTEEAKAKMRISQIKTPEQRKKISLAHMGKHVSAETRLKMSLSKRGALAPNWKGGVNAVHDTIRKSVEYKLWREAVFARDKYTCIWCGDNRGGNLNADHIKPFAYFPELRFAIDNGRTLCKSCHKKTDTWGSKSKIYENKS